MPKHEAAMLAYLLIFSITAMALGVSENPWDEVKSQEELALSTISHDNPTSPINGSTYPKINALSSLKKRVRDIQSENLTARVSMKGGACSLEGTVVALRTNDGHYLSAKKYSWSYDTAILDATGTTVGDSEKFVVTDLGNNRVAFKWKPTGEYITENTIEFYGRTPAFICLGDKVTPYNTFKKTCYQAGGWSLLGYEGKYLGAENGGGGKVLESSTTFGPWETLELEIQDEPLQKAIDATGPGGTINLKEGIYRGSVTIDKSVNLIGAGSGATFVDGDKKASVITIGKTNSNIDVALAHMVIQKGLSENGGGINNFGRLTIDDTIITRNEATGSGGGVSNKDGTMVMNSGVIMHNKANQGGGVNNDHSTVTMNNGGIIENTAVALGGGIYSTNGGIFKFIGGSISNNIPDNIYPNL